MPSLKSKSVLTGILLLSGIVAGILSSVPALERPDYIAALAEISGQVYMAAVFQGIFACVYTGLACVLYSVLKDYEPGIALLYFSFRIVGAAALFLAIVPLPLLLMLSKQYLEVGNDHGESLIVIAELVRLTRDGINHMAMILPWSIGGMFLYIGAINSRLLPGWISWWGLLGSFLTFMATGLLIVEVIQIASPIYFILNTPTALVEIVLAIYLLWKGFRPPADGHGQPGAP